MIVYLSVYYVYKRIKKVGKWKITHNYVPDFFFCLLFVIVRERIRFEIKIEHFWGSTMCLTVLAMLQLTYQEFHRT